MEDRIKNFIKALPEELDGALVCSHVGRAYLTGLHSSAGTLLVLREAVYLIIDFRYIEKARLAVKGCEVILEEKLSEQLNKLLEQHQAHRLGIESSYLTVERYQAFQEKLSAEIVMGNEVSRILQKMRMRKSPEEVRKIKEAQKITDETFSHILNYIRPGMAEREVARELRDFADRQGSQGPSFDYIVVSGKNSSMPHGVPTEKSIAPGDFVTMDFGCIIDGYCSDMTRTIAVGSCTDEMRQVYETVLAAQNAAFASIRPGVSCKEADAAARNIIEKNYKGCFGHGTGHSVGLEIHEPPACNTRDTTLLEPGIIMTVEPGIYLEGRFGVRIEDMVLVTETGCENLTGSPKELFIL